MKTKIKKLPKSEIELEIEILPEEFNKFIEKATLNLASHLEIKGFRKGKLPKEIIEREISRERILEEAVQLAVKENYQKVILENGIEAISQPIIEILKIPIWPQNKDIGMVSTNSLVFRAKFQVLPEINLPDYKKISSQIERNEILIKESEIEKVINWLQKSRAKFILKNGICQKGDFVEIEYSSPQIERGEMRRDKFILGQGHLIPGLEENLEGMRAGQEKEITLLFPKEHFQKDLAGKLVNFKIKMKGIQKVELPEINDHFAQGLGQFENLAKLKESIREGLKIEKEMAEKQRVRSEILEKVIKELDLELPEILIEFEKKRILEELKERISQTLGLTFKEYLNKINKTEEELLESFLPEAEKRIKISLTLMEIAKKEKIEILEEEVEDEINQILKKYPDIERAERELDLTNLKEYTKEVIRNRKTLDRLESFVKQ